MIDLNKLNYVRLEFSDGDKSNKFWAIAKKDDRWGASWGKIGYAAAGSSEYSHTVAQKKVHEKIAKGYKMVTGHTAGPISKKEAAAVDFKKLMEEL